MKQYKIYKRAGKKNREKKIQGVPLYSEPVKVLAKVLYNPEMTTLLTSLAKMMK